MPNKIHLYRVRIIYKTRPDLLIAVWLSRQKNKENRDEEIQSMNINITAIQMTDTPNCMTAQTRAIEIAKDDHLHQLRLCIIRGW